MKKVMKAPVSRQKAPATKPASSIPRSNSSKAVAAAAKPAVPKPRCGSCGHWSIATEYGVDDRSGYCDRWEKLTDRDYVCDEYVSREKFKAMQQELAEQHEEYLDEDTG